MKMEAENGKLKVNFPFSAFNFQFNKSPQDIRPNPC
jgi:hypothetical protein